MSVEAITWALKAKTGSSTAKAVLLVLSNYADIHGVCWPSFRSVSERAECSVSSVKRVVSEMEQQGLLQRIRLRRKDGQMGAYRITLAMPLGAVEEVCDSVSDVPKAPEVNLVSGVKPELNLTRAQSDLRSNTHAPELTMSSLEPNNINIIDAAVVANAPPARETSDWPSRLREAQARAGDALNMTASGVHHFADLRRLCEPSSGIPCDWEFDALPAIDELAASFRAKRDQFRSWAIIGPTAIRNRDRRLAGNPDPKEQPAHVQPVESPKHYGITASNLAMRDRSNRAALAALRSLGAVGDDGGREPAEGAEPRRIGRSVVGGA